MAKIIERKNHTVDATDKVLGRLAVEISNLLRGKSKPDYVPYLDMGDFVVVKNAKDMRLTGKKMEQKKYYHHSGYRGGLKAIPIEKTIEKKGRSEVIRKAVMGMLPKNKLRDQQIKRLKVEI